MTFSVILSDPERSRRGVEGSHYNLQYTMLNFLFTQTPLAFLTQSFWRDEAFSYFLAKKNVLEIIILSAKDFNPPLYQLLLHFWLKIFGPSEISIRSLSLLFFWATLYVCFLFLQEIFKFNFKKSLIYLLLFLLNPFLLYYAFEARMYSLFTFLATLSFYSFYRKKYRLHLLASILGLYTHYFMLFVMASQLFFNFFINKRGRGYEDQTPNNIIFKPLFLFFPWFIFILFQKNFFTTSFWIQSVRFETLVNLMGTVYTGYDGGYQLYANKITLISLVILLLIVILFKLRIKKNYSDKRLLFFLSIWAIGIPLFVIFISLVKSIYFPRYFIFSTVGFILFLIYLLERVRGLGRTIAIILLIIIALDYHLIQIKNYQKKDFRKLAQEVKTIAKKDDPIYVSSELDFFTAKYYLPDHQLFCWQGLNLKK